MPLPDDEVNSDEHSNAEKAAFLNSFSMAANSRKNPRGGGLAQTDDAADPMEQRMNEMKAKLR